MKKKYKCSSKDCKGTNKGGSCKCVIENGKLLMRCAECRKEFNKQESCPTCGADLPPNHPLRK